VRQEKIIWDPNKQNEKGRCKKRRVDMKRDNIKSNVKRTCQMMKNEKRVHDETKTDVKVRLNQKRRSRLRCEETKWNKKRMLEVRWDKKIQYEMRPEEKGLKRGTFKTRGVEMRLDEIILNEIREDGNYETIGREEARWKLKRLN